MPTLRNLFGSALPLDPGVLNPRGRIDGCLPVHVAGESRGSAPGSGYLIRCRMVPLKRSRSAALENEESAQTVVEDWHAKNRTTCRS
jgi:hypothetical protein